MGKFLDYNPDQAYWLRPGHLCFFLRQVVAKLNLEAFRNEYGVSGTWRGTYRLTTWRGC
jgi:hypothetical protein